jgi:hypothetical protein
MDSAVQPLPMQAHGVRKREMLLKLHSVLDTTGSESRDAGDFAYWPIQYWVGPRVERAIGDRAGHIQLLREAHAVLTRKAHRRAAGGKPPVQGEGSEESSTS